MVKTNVDVVVDTFKEFLKGKCKDFSATPKIALISGTEENSLKHINAIIDTLKATGLEYTNRTFSDNATEEVVNYIKELNSDDSIHGIYVEGSSFKESRGEIVNGIHSVKDIGANSLFIKSVFFTQGSNLSPKLWAIKTFLETNGYYVYSPFNCAVVGMEDECNEIVQYFASKNATTMLLRPHTVDLQDFAQKAHIVVLNDVSLIPSNLFKEDAVIINTSELNTSLEPLSGSLYLDYENYLKLFYLGIAWNLLVSYTTLTREGVD